MNINLLFLLYFKLSLFRDQHILKWFEIDCRDEDISDREFGKYIQIDPIAIKAVSQS